MAYEQQEPDMNTRRSDFLHVEYMKIVNFEGPFRLGKRPINGVNNMHQRTLYFDIVKPKMTTLRQGLGNPFDYDMHNCTLHTQSTVRNKRLRPIVDHGRERTAVAVVGPSDERDIVCTFSSLKL